MPPLSRPDAILRVPLTTSELETIVLALKLGTIRYGMLAQLAGQRDETVLPFEATIELLNSLELMSDQCPAP